MSEMFTDQFSPVSSHEDLRYALWHLIEGQKAGDFDRRDGAELRILATDKTLRAENERLREALKNISEETTDYTARSIADAALAEVGK